MTNSQLDKPATKQDIQNLKYWLDTEVTLLHIAIWIILGLVIGGKFWWVSGIGIAVSLVYISAKASKLPKGYLK